MHRVVEEAIAAGGPRGSADFEHRRAPGAAGGWWNWKPAAHALDHLWMSGRTLVHSRTHFRKRFDLAERVMPDAVGLEPLTREGFQRWHLRQSLRALGAASESDLRLYLTFPRAAAADRRRALRAALDAGEVVEVEVAGERGRWLALAEDLPALAAAGRRRRPAAGTTLLSPFDSFLWHRDRVPEAGVAFMLSNRFATRATFFEITLVPRTDGVLNWNLRGRWRWFHAGYTRDHDFDYSRFDRSVWTFGLQLDLDHDLGS